MVSWMSSTDLASRLIDAAKQGVPAVSGTPGLQGLCHVRADGYGQYRMSLQYDAARQPKPWSPTYRQSMWHAPDCGDQ